MSYDPRTVQAVRELIAKGDDRTPTPTPTPHHPPTFDVKRTAEALKAEIRAFGDRPAPTPTSAAVVAEEEA